MASKEEREKYDEKKLCRATEILSIFVGLMCTGLTFLSYLVEIGRVEEALLGPVGIIFTILIIVAVAIDMVVSNKCCLK